MKTGQDKEQRLRKVLAYFKNGARPTEPSLDAHGLDPNYKGINGSEGVIDYIYGPYADYKDQGANTGHANVFPKMTQLCVRSWNLAGRFDEAMIRAPIVLCGEKWRKIQAESKEFWRALREDR
jgi:hypothetical protein